MFCRNFKMPCDLFNRNATRFNHEINNISNSGIWIELEDRRCDAKSLLGLLSMGIRKGDTISFISYDENYKSIFDKLESLINSL